MTQFAERRFTSSDGLSLYWRDYGDALSAAPPVLCLSGLTRNSKDFHDLAARLCPQRRVISLDYRGRGQSEYDPDWHRYEPRIYLQDIRHLLAVAGLVRVIIIGTSLGGALAMALGLLMPGALAGVVMNDIGPGLSNDGLGRILDYIGTDRPQADWASAAAHLRTIFPNLSLKTEEQWLIMARNTFRPGSDGLLHFDWDVRLAEPLRRSRDPLDLWPMFRSLRSIPTLCIRGGASDVLSEESFARMRDEKPDLSQAVVPGCGHCPTLDEPEAVAALDSFLAAVDDREGSGGTNSVSL